MKTSIIILAVILLPGAITAGNSTQKITEGNNRFAFSLYRQLKAGNPTNLLFSNFSISAALAMTYAGARNKTEDQISRVMNFTTGELFHSDFGTLMAKIDQNNQEGIVLNIANGLWVQKDFPFLNSYFDLVKRNYSAVLKSVDFKNPDARKLTCLDINSWVEEKTHDKIRNILKDNDLDTFSRLVLVNAIYFKGEWQTQFKNMNTHDAPFFISSTEQIQHKFMNQMGSYRYYKDSLIKAIELPYKDFKVSMIIFLPIIKDGIPELERFFDYDYYQKVISSFKSEQVAISVPKFKVECRFELGSTLKNMGMADAFSPVDADFTSMTGHRDLYISKVIHQSFINVDEQGTEAAAATAVIIRAGSSRPQTDLEVFKADHPFIFIIKENSTGSILFMGKVENPDKN